MSKNESSCECVRENLVLFIDGQLPSEETSILQRHLSECDTCETELRSLRSSWDLLSSLEPVALPAGFEARFWAKERRSQTSSTWIDRIVTWPRLVTAMAGFTALWIVSVGLGASLFFQKRALSSSQQWGAMLSPPETSLSDVFIKRVSNSSPRSSL